MATCSYCSSPIEPGTGKMYVRKDGKVFDLCGTKCEYNWTKLNRKPLQLKWTESARKFKKAQHKNAEKEQ